MVRESFSSGETLALERRRVGLSQVALAQRLGLHVGIIADWERGQRAIPPDYAERLARLIQAARLSQAAADTQRRAERAPAQQSHH